MDSNKPPISIGISFYNAEATLLDAVRSVFAQTYQNWELILVDDGSTDRSLELAKSIVHPKVRVYSDGKNRKLAARLNEITKLAKYDYLARMDADDLIAPTRLEKQVDVLLSQPDINLVSTGVCSLTDDYQPVGIRCTPQSHVITAANLLSGKAGIVHASLLGHREWFMRNPYKESMLKSQDTNLWVRSFCKNDLRVVFIEEALYYYREDGNVTREQLLLAYAMGRHTILYDAKARFKTTIKLKALVVNLLKTFIVSFFSFFSMKSVRKRRNKILCDESKVQKYVTEIDYIRNIKLPISKSD